MDPIKVEISPKKGYVILHRCRKCGEIKESACVCCTQDEACVMVAKHKGLWSFCSVSAYI